MDHLDRRSALLRAATAVGAVAAVRFAGPSRLIAQGMPEQFASFAREIFTASRRGEFAAVDPALKQLLGREPTHFRDVLAATLPR